MLTVSPGADASMASWIAENSPGTLRVVAWAACGARSVATAARAIRRIGAGMLAVIETESRGRRRPGQSVEVVMRSAVVSAIVAMVLAGCSSHPPAVRVPTPAPVPDYTTAVDSLLSGV